MIQKSHKQGQLTRKFSIKMLNVLPHCVFSNSMETCVAWLLASIQIIINNMQNTCLLNFQSLLMTVLHQVVEKTNFLIIN